MPGPLQGLKVVELAGLGPAPLACTLLADLGAHVLRIDRPGAAASGGEGLAHGRAMLRVDLRSAEGLERVKTLVAQADVLIEGYRPGVAERLGLGPDPLLELNPRLVYGRMTGWGQDGPLAARAGHDINYLSLTGALHAIGEAGRDPVPPLNLVADFGGGSLFLLVGVLAALQSRATTGKGQVVDAAMVDGAAYLMLMIYRMLGMGVWTDERGVNALDGGAPFYGTYPTSDGRHMAVGPIEPAFYAQLLDKLGLGEAALPAQQEVSRWAELRSRLADAFAAKDQAHWVSVFDGSDACVSPVRSLREAPQDPHLLARGTFLAGIYGPEPGPAPRFSVTRASREDGTTGTLRAFGLTAE